VLFRSLAEAHLGERSDAGAIRADLMLARGELYRNMYRAEDAVAALTQAVELHRAVYGAESPRLATAMTRLGMARFDADGCVLIEQARVLRERVLGAGHPELADSYDRLATCAVNANDPERAAELHTRALSLRRAALGPEHRDVARSCFNFAWLRLNQDRLEDTEALYECARVIYARIGNRHFEAASLIGLADVRMRQARLEEAETLLASAGAIYRETVPREHGSVARLETQLGRLALLQRAPAVARTHYDEALRISRATHEGDVEGLALEGAGRAELALGHASEARALFESALARLAPTGTPNLAGATLRFRFAEVRLAEDPEARSEARALAVAARSEIASSPAAWAATSISAEIDAWLTDAGSGAIGIGGSARWGDGVGVRRAAQPRALP
jgi:serine/threonine-protein kinase